MRSLRSAVAVVAGTIVLLPATARAQKLDEEDKRFLSDVHPIMLLDEEATFRRLEDKADRLEFRKIFWARRDPKTLARYAERAAPENDFERQYRKDLATADDRFHFATTRGSSSDCGRFLILLGKPDSDYHDVQNGAVWVYEDRPGLDLGGPPGRLVIRFDQDCRAEGTIAQHLERIAATKVVHREIGYVVGRDGHLVPLAAQLPADTLARLLLNDPRQDFPLAVQPFFLRSADGGTALVGLVRGVAAVAGSTSARTVDVEVAASAVAEDGTESDRTDRTMKASVGADGAFVGSFRLTPKPGRHTLKVGVLQVDSGSGAVAALPVEVPDVAGVDSAVLLLLREIEDVPADGARATTHPYAAFSLGTTRLVPHFGSTLHTTDPLVIFYQAYNLAADENGRADGTVTVSLMRGPSALASHREAIATPIAGSAVGPVPLATLDPGRYLVRLTLEDRLSHGSQVREQAIEVIP